MAPCKVPKGTTLYSLLSDLDLLQRPVIDFLAFKAHPPYGVVVERNGRQVFDEWLKEDMDKGNNQFSKKTDKTNAIPIKKQVNSQGRYGQSQSYSNKVQSNHKEGTGIASLFCQTK